MIYRFKPILKTLVWGSENWVLSGVKGSESVVAEGPLAGKTLNEVYGGEFPLLIKFIEAHDDLSIQVHPNDELAAKRHGCKGKTEMWYIIGAAPGAHLFSGFSKPLTPDEYVRLVAEDKIIDVLADHKVAPGDVFFLPAGRVHAICSGCYLAEIQETSDITYRIYDYGRPGLDGKPRELHTALAREAIDFTPAADYRTHYEPRPDTGVELLRDPHFVTSLYDLSKAMELNLEGMGRFLSVICIEGSGEVGGVPIKAGEALLVDCRGQKTSFVPAGEKLKLLTAC